MMVARLVLASLLVACGGSRGPKGPASDLDQALDNMKMYEPFAMRDDAKAPTQAIILGTDPKGGSTVIKLAAASGEVTASAMGVRLRITTAPNADGTVHVGTFEERPDGADATQWRASVWVAALVAANTLGKDPTDFRFSVSSGGDLDGPSASALIAAGFLATMIGTPIDPTATLAGTIQVDGTIGPAAGLADKFTAALASGAKKLGYPSGMRRVHTSATTVIDLEELARSRGAIAVEVADLRDAYRLLTGKTLVAPVAVAVDEMAVEPATTKVFEAKYATWRTQLEALAATLQNIHKTPKLPVVIGVMARSADAFASKAATLRTKGALAAAYGRLVTAWIYATAAVDTFEVWTKLAAGDPTAAYNALAQLDELDPGRGLRPIVERKPTTIGGHIQVMSGFRTALRGWGYGALAQASSVTARGELRSLDAKADPADLVPRISTTYLLRAASLADATAAADGLEYETTKSLKYMCSIPNVRRLTTAFRAASAAGLHYFDALVVEPFAAKHSITLDEARLRIASNEPKYVIAYSLAQIDTMNDDAKQAYPGLTLDLLMLAATERAYLDSVELATKLYALDGARYAVAADREAAVERMLDNAERAARIHARAALVATGDIPVQAKIAFQYATALRAGDFDDKLAALVNYWSASSSAQTTMMMARN